MEIKDFLQKNKQNIIDDISDIISYRSVKSDPLPSAPFGQEIRDVQLKAIDLCRREGFDTTDADGMISFADYGPMEQFIGVFSHLDVVPEGDGWDTPAYTCTEREGFLVGRGVGDNKGPFIMSLYALKYIKENNIPLKYGIRLLIGVDEESGMTDAEYYVDNYPQPVFTFTPDSDFPVCHGEKGIYQIDFVSSPLGSSNLISMDGGLASNVVPDYASAILIPALYNHLLESAKDNENIKVAIADEGVIVEAIGITAHAGTPFKGVNAIYVLLTFLIESGVLTESEKNAATFICSIAKDVYGRGVGIECDDKIFVPLTVVVGIATKEKDVFKFNINIRYPTAVTAEELRSKLEKAANENGFTIESSKSMPPFYLDPKLPAIQMLSNIYAELSKKDPTPYVMSGGTYARKIKNAVAFGPDFKDSNYPDWVGAAHMKNEGLNIEDMLLAIEIYTEVLIRLQEVDF